MSWTLGHLCISICPNNDKKNLLCRYYTVCHSLENNKNVDESSCTRGRMLSASFFFFPRMLYFCTADAALWVVLAVLAQAKVDGALFFLIVFDTQHYFPLLNLGRASRHHCRWPHFKHKSFISRLFITPDRSANLTDAEDTQCHIWAAARDIQPPPGENKLCFWAANFWRHRYPSDRCTQTGKNAPFTPAHLLKTAFSTFGCYKDITRDFSSLDRGVQNGEKVGNQCLSKWEIWYFSMKKKKKT